MWLQRRLHVSKLLSASGTPGACRGVPRTIDPKHSKFKTDKFAVELYDLNRFFANFPQKIKVNTGKRPQKCQKIAGC